VEESQQLELTRLPAATRLVHGPHLVAVWGQISFKVHFCAARRPISTGRFRVLSTVGGINFKSLFSISALGVAFNSILTWT
jgi:hypothetical protein